MEFASLFALLLLCGVSQQAPNQLIRRGNIAGTSAHAGDGKSVKMTENTEEKEPKSLSIDMKSLLNNQLSRRRQDVIDLVRNITPAVATATNDQKLEKHSTIGKIPEDSQQERASSKDQDDGTSNRQNKKQYYDANSIEGKNTSQEKDDSLGSAPLRREVDSQSEADSFQNEHISEDEDKKDVVDGPVNPNTSEDSVAAFVKRDSASRITKNVIPDQISNEHDSVASYIGLNVLENQEKSGTFRDKIEEKDVDNDQNAISNADAGDQPASIDTMTANADTVSGEAKDKISTAKSTMDMDSVSPYIGLVESQQTGALRNGIAENKERNDDEEQDRAAEDSIASFIRPKGVGGEAKDVISRRLKQEDSVAPYIETVNNQRKAVTRSKITDKSDTSEQPALSDKTSKSKTRDSVASYITTADAGAVSGETKDKISTAKSTMDMDSVSPYIGLVESQQTGALRNGIAENEKRNDDEEQDRAAEDSVASFIRPKGVGGEAKDVISRRSKQEDSVAPYIETVNNQRKAVTRSKITDKSDTSEQPALSDKTSKSKTRDSVASYITTADAGAVSGETKDKISTAKSTMDMDSVSPYIGLVGSQQTGALRNGIAENEERNDDEEQDRAAEDSVASFMRQKGVGGEAKDVISRRLKKGDSVAPYIETVNNQGKAATRSEITDKSEASASGEMVNDVSDETDDDDEAIIRENSDEDEASGENKLHSSKTQAILEDLEEGLTNEGSGGLQSKEKLTYEPGEPGKFWHPGSRHNKSKEHSSSYVVQQPYSVPIQYNMPQYTEPQYIYVSINDADKKGAVCLDGSIPGYFYRRGVGNGAKRWIIYLQGGAWCDSKEDCYERSKSNLGSSSKFAYLTNAEGLLSRDQTKNPDFYDWNVVYVPYCDGGSFTGNRSHPVIVKGKMIYLRGKRILSALLDDLLVHGLKDSEKVVFSGTSAGGLAVFLNADFVRSRIPSKANVYSLADSGVFLDANDMKGRSAFVNSMKAVFKLHELSGSINSKCADHQGKKHAWKCLFPYYFGEYIQTPLFVVNPLHDSWQLANVIGIHCAYKPEKCTKEEMKAVKTFREQTLKALSPFIKNPHTGLFADACVDHGQIIFSPKWTKIIVRNRSMSGTFVRWMKNEENTKSVIDLQKDEYPFNPTCVSHFHD